MFQRRGSGVKVRKGKSGKTAEARCLHAPLLRMKAAYCAGVGGGAIGVIAGTAGVI